MDIGKAIYNILSNTSNITSVVDTRIFPSRYINDTVNHAVPYITYQKVSQDPNNTKNGPSTYDYVTVQINVYAEEYQLAVSISDNVRTALDYTSGTFNTVVVDKCFFESSTDVFYDNAGSTGIYGISSDYRFNINRDVIFSPLTPTGLQSFMLSVEGVVIDDDGVGVIQWSDISTNSNNATQNTAFDIFQPTFSNKGITFNGDNDFLTYGSQINLNEFHIFLAVALGAASTETLFGETSAGDFLRFGQGTSTTAIRFQCQSAQFNFSSFSPAIATDGTIQLFDFARASGTTDNVTMTINGNEHSTKASSNTSTDTFEIGAIGVRNTTNQQFPLDGTIYAIVIYNNVLSSSDATKVRNYINQIYSIYV